MLVKVFPHSNKEFESDIALKYWLKYTLPAEWQGRYRLRTTNGVGSIPPGSVVLFRFGSAIVGSAVVAKDVEPISEVIGSMEYKGVIFFQPDSIKIYDPSIPMEFLEDLTKRDMNFGQAYYKIEILKE